MKILHLIRHAKSSWDDQNLSDKQRPLKQRGINDCQLMAQLLNKQQGIFDCLFSSPAKRAKQTINQLLSYSDQQQKVHLDEELYTFNSNNLLHWWQSRDNTYKHITQVGHNPAMTDLIEHLSDEFIGNLPTCGYAQLLFDGNHWQDLGANSCQLVALFTPKQLKHQF